MTTDTLSDTTLGHDIDYLHSVREKKRKLEEQLNEVKDHQQELEAKLIERMKTEGVYKASGARMTVSRDQATFPHIVDWSLVEDYVHRNKYYHLFQRRLSAPAWNELCAKRKGVPVPGTEPHVKDTLSLTSISPKDKGSKAR